MSSLNITVNGSTEQLVRITRISELGKYFNLFCFNRVKNYSATFKGIKEVSMLQDLLKLSYVGHILTIDLSDRIDIGTIIQEMQDRNEEIKDINIEV